MHNAETCEFCINSKKRKEALESKDPVKLAEAVEYFSNLWLQESEDRNYLECILSFRLPRSREILEAKVKKFLEKERVEIAALANKLYKQRVAADSNYNNPEADWLDAENYLKLNDQIEF